MELILFNLNMQLLMTTINQYIMIYMEIPATLLEIKNFAIFSMKRAYKHMLLLIKLLALIIIKDGMSFMMIYLLI
jgi:hypothetical protein